MVYAGREAVRPEVEPTAADIDIIGGKLTPKGEADYREWVRSYKRHQILVARYNDNINDALTIAGNDKVLQSFLAERWRRRPGEQKRRPRDHSPARAGELDELLAEIALLRQLWKAHNIKVKAPIEAARDIIIKRARGGERLLTALAARYKNRARAKARRSR